MINKSTKVSKKSLEMAWNLIGLKIYTDYRACISSGLSVEPESFYEKWVSRNLVKPTKKCKVQSWRIFIDCLFRDIKKAK